MPGDAAKHQFLEHVRAMLSHDNQVTTVDSFLYKDIRERATVHDEQPDVLTWYLRLHAQRFQFVQRILSGG
jgi:hypothetical protein